MVSGKSSTGSEQPERINAKISHFMLNKLYWKLLGLGMQAQAWQAFERATQVRPPWPRPWANLIQLARQMQKPAAEIAKLTEHYHELKQAQQARRDAWRQALTEPT